MLTTIVIWGLVVGLIHFFVVGVMYGNPIVDRVYQRAMQTEPGVKRWPSRPRYLVTQFLGTQVEVYAVTTAYVVLRGPLGVSGLGGAVTLGLLFAALRVYPRFWNMWIQSTYPNRLLAIEAVAGTVSTLTITIALELIL